MENNTELARSAVGKFDEAVRRHYPNLGISLGIQRLTGEVGVLSQAQRLVKLCRELLAAGVEQAEREALGKVIAKVRDARNDEAPFSRDQAQFATNLIQKKNAILDEIIGDWAGVKSNEVAAQ